jgi:hypothetical protein
MPSLLLTINVPAVYIARDEMILIRAISIYEGHGRGGPEIKTFLGPEIEMSKASAFWCPKKSRFQGPPLPIA